MRAYLVAALALLAVGQVAASRDLKLQLLSDDEFGQSIVGGTPAPKGRYQYFTTLNYRGIIDGVNASLGVAYCGAVLIDPYVVATVASCFYYQDLPPNPDGTGFYPGVLFPKIHINAYARDGSGPSVVTRNVTRVIIHSWYKFFDNDYSYDIALLYFKEPVRNVARARLPGQYNPDGAAVPVGTPLVAMGMGSKTERVNEEPTFPKYLQEATLPLQENEYCKKAYPGQSWARGWFVCGDAPGKNLCNRDLGGPWVQKGTSSTGSQDLLVGLGCLTRCLADAPAGFTNTARLIYWIQNGIKIFKGGRTIAPTDNFQLYDVKIMYPDWCKEVGVEYC